MTKISKTIIGPYTLSSTNSPLTITSTGTVLGTITTMMDAPSLTIISNGAVLINDGTIIGGEDDYQGTAGVALGVAAGIDATIENIGVIIGGAGLGGDANAGAVFSGGTLDNLGSITGGYVSSYYTRLPSGATILAGAGVKAGGGTLTNFGAITGGAAGDDGATISLTLFAGAGLVGSGNATIENYGIVLGGFGFHATAGDGADLSGNAALTNVGLIYGGSLYAPDRAHGDHVGAGVVMTGNAYLNNDSGKIVGGGGSGGDGVMLSGSALLVNGARGIIEGGGGYGVVGGDAVFLSGGTLENAGTILRGGTSYSSGYGVALRFGAVAGTIIADVGAVFIGSVVANATVSDLLVLAGDSTAAFTGLGGQFENFHTIAFAGGAARTLAGAAAALTTLTAIDGFSMSDAIVLDGFVAKSETYIAGTGLILTNATASETLALAGGLPAPAQFYTKGGNTTVYLANSTISNYLPQSVTAGAGGYARHITITSSGAVIGQSSQAGVSLASAGASVLNDGFIEGASPGTRGAAGAGIAVTAAGSINNQGVIRGGYGYTGYAGADGIDLAGKAKLTNAGTISGGTGGYGANGAGYVGNQGNPGYTGGAGGIGLAVTAKAKASNAGVIVGGAGGQGGAGVSQTYGGAGGSGGHGGVGLVLTAGLLTNTGTIAGGHGGNGGVGGYSFYAGPPYDGDGGNGGNGAAGVYLNGGTLVTKGVIEGGAGGTGAASVHYGNPGNNGAAGIAVQFGPVAGTLVVETGAVFHGAVVANAAVKDVLEVSGAGKILSGIGTKFTGFKDFSFAAGATWTLEGSVAALANGQTISGFAYGDEIYLDDSAIGNGFVEVNKTGVLTIVDGSHTYTMDLAGAVKGSTVYAFSDHTLYEEPPQMPFLAAAQPAPATALPEMTFHQQPNSWLAPPPAAMPHGAIHDLIPMQHRGIFTMVTIQTG